MGDHDFFGIDIGTRTTVVFRWDAAQGEATPVKIGGDNIIPTATLDFEGQSLIGRQALEKAAQEPDLGKKLSRNFKIHFWVRDGRPPRLVRTAKSELKHFLSLLWDRIEREFGHEAGRAAYCFTYPAQRRVHQDEFEQLVIDAGFPESRVRFLDEPMAAALGYYHQTHRRGLGGRLKDSLLSLLGIQTVDGSEPGESTGTACIVDIGAGTTDVSVASIKSDRLDVLANRSIDVAGNRCTEALGALARGVGHKPAKDPAAAWKKFTAEEPHQADRYKEVCLSDHYRITENREHPQSVLVGRRFFELVCTDFGTFKNSARECWNHIRRTIDKTRADAGRSRIDRYLLVGGGARHSGIASLAEECFPGTLKVAPNPQQLVAQGAMFHCLRLSQTSGKLVRALRVRSVVQDRISVEFPADCAQEEVVLFDLGERIEVDRPEVEKRETIELRSNWFLAEGECFLVRGVGHNVERIPLGEIDIDWGIESNDHPGHVSALLDPSSGSLRVKVELENVDLHNTVVGDAQIRLGVRGGFEHVK